MNVGSLFTGIGGVDLGLERAGMRVLWQSEIDPYASRVLAKHWPDVPNLGDITQIDWSTVEHVDLICGGYPCQPFSLAGVRRGESDPRHLWPHFHRAIRHLRPRHALLENVPGHLSMGFGRVLGDLAEIGYDVEWCSIPAAAVGAPHLRWRIFAVATDAGSPRRRQDSRGASRDEGEDAGRPAEHDHIFGGDGTVRTVADAERQRLQGRDIAGGLQGLGAPRGEPARSGEPCGGGAVADADGGRLEGAWGAHHWAVEPDVGRVADGLPNRVDRLRCLGNAVVPQVAELVGRWILEAAA